MYLYSLYVDPGERPRRRTLTEPVIAADTRTGSSLLLTPPPRSFRSDRALLLAQNLELVLVDVPRQHGRAHSHQGPILSHLRDKVHSGRHKHRGGRRRRR